MSGYIGRIVTGEGQRPENSSVNKVEYQRGVERIDRELAPGVTPTEDLREQIARLAEQRVTAFLDEMDRLDAIRRNGAHYAETIYAINDIELTRTDLRAILANVAARERAAAEKALLGMADRLAKAEDTSYDTGEGDSSYEYKVWSEGSGIHAIFASNPEDFISEVVKREYTVKESPNAE